MRMDASRILLRDFEPLDRAAFVAYQMDPRYRGLYDLEDDPRNANELFDRFIDWQAESPRYNFQLGIFASATSHLCGCAGLRVRRENSQAAVLGIELAPSVWGRYRFALDVVAHLVEYGFTALSLETIIGDTASGNDRVRKIAQWFGAKIVDSREGPDWMRQRGWHEVDWALTRQEWEESERRRAFLTRTHCSVSR